MVRELRLAGKSASRASASTLHAVDSTVLSNDESNVCHRAEHYTSVTQCSSQVSEVVLEALPSIQALSQNSPFNNEELGSPISIYWGEGGPLLSIQFLGELNASSCILSIYKTEEELAVLKAYVGKRKEHFVYRNNRNILEQEVYCKVLSG